MAANIGWMGAYTPEATAAFLEANGDTAKGDYELLKQGNYKAIIKNAVIGEIGDKKTPALVIHFELEDNQGEFSANYWLDMSKEFLARSMKNLATRAMYSHLSEKEFRTIPQQTLLTDMQRFMADGGLNLIIGKKVQVFIEQSPFISKDKETKEFKFTDFNKTALMNTAPIKLANVIKKIEQENNIHFEKFPQFMFSNKIKGCGLSFYNDYVAKEPKDSKAYEFIQGLTTPNSGDSNEPIGEEEIAF